MESNIRALVLLNLLNSLRKRFYQNRLINSIKNEHSCKILYIFLGNILDKM